MKSTLRSWLSLPLVLVVLFGCGQDAGEGAGGGETETMATGDTAYDVEIPDVTYAWDPAAGDPSVSAELGGPGFTGEGWTTNLTFPALGSAEAIKGGSATQDLPDWPATLRMAGKDWNSSINYTVADLCYSGLVTVHPNTLEFIPVVASHWSISDDKMTYRYRINPDARWSDGTEVTAEDYVATWKLKTDETTLSPSTVHTYSKFEPRAVSKYILEIAVKEESWRNFLYASGMTIFPAKEIGNMTGTEYLDKYQFAYTSFCGPYMVNLEDVVEGQSITLTRNPNWWAKDNPANQGLYNLDRFRYVVVKESQLAFEMAKKGQLDYYVIPRAQWFKEDLPKEDVVKRGLVVRRKFYNDAPIGTSGLAFNMRRAPLNELPVRKALAHLYDRKLMIEKLYYNEYEPLESYWQGATYGNPNNEKIEYDETAAFDLLVGAGWEETNEDGYRVKDGNLLEFKLMYRSKTSESSLTLFQESCKTLGIKLDLQLLTPSAFWKNLQEKEYDVASMAWGALVFPNPESSWRGNLADQLHNNNVTAFANDRVDELCGLYDEEYDVQRRRELIQEIDGIIFNEHPYALGWYNPAQRVVTTNKFVQPEWGALRTTDRSDLFHCWWVDPEKEKLLEAAWDDETITMPIPPLDHRFWEAWNVARAKKSAAGGRVQT